MSDLTVWKCEVCVDCDGECYVEASGDDADTPWNCPWGGAHAEWKLFGGEDHKEIIND